jgi:hypothetical protein
MVSTSISCKIIEHLKLGRAIAFCDPPYASIPCCFIEIKRPFVALSQDYLTVILDGIKRYVYATTIERYLQTLTNDHRPNAIAKRLYSNSNNES